MRAILLALLSASGLGLASCASVGDRITSDTAGAIECVSDRDSYVAGQAATIRCEGGGGRARSLRLVRIDGKFVEQEPVATARWAAGESTGELRWTPDGADAGHGYAVFVDGDADAPFAQRVKTTFRVLRPGELTRFSIVRHDLPGIAVFDLDGGMSAEYALEKAVSGLAGGMSHSWRVARSGHGPRPVFATRDFLRASVRETVALYDRELGADRPFDTVIISTGYPAVPYLSQALNAPVLPLHFLASADSVAEIRTVLEGASDAGTPAYATLGHDPSVDHAVAWVKLLDLPEEYRDFLVRHDVKTVIISGSTGTAGGETKARKIGPDDRIGYAPGDIYLMYPGTSDSDEASLAEKVMDLGRQPVSDFVRITDWESGVAAQQTCAIARSVEALDVQAFGLTATELGDLYDLASTVTVASMARNRELYPDAATAASGIVLNPYLMAYPAQEFRAGYVPIVYFQVVPPEATLADLQTVIAPALAKYFPDRKVEDSRVWVNSSKNFGGRFFGKPYEAELARLGFAPVHVNDYDQDEQWSPGDGLKSMSERMASKEVAQDASRRLTAWARKRAALTPEELAEAVSLHPRIRLDRRPGC